ncbi:Ketosteroid isomerase homolog [Chitinophaga sp. YR627]|uniref:YybH family protein n=1 Tax=Chitinophaga sp. YR627 TaxID=1881041 RepID=UPI0008EB5A8E|nr:nuclear transport factor 2 family protein [Chitinophaga sp. YR627]SFM83991.1 Ketosteroid isomerase homolog [Chitinophaga sp. YR627]
MQSQQENQAIEKLLSDFAATLNAATIQHISSFFTEDAVFMPDGFKILKAADLKRTGNGYLQRSHFQIGFTIKEVEIGLPYAFVRATAAAALLDPDTQQLITQQSRDFFVLRKDNEDWKIFRYMFNRVKVK